MQDQAAKRSRQTVNNLLSDGGTFTPGRCTLDVAASAEPKMNQNENKDQSCTLTAVPQDRALPAEHEDILTNTANEHGRRQKNLFLSSS